LYAMFCVIHTQQHTSRVYFVTVTIDVKNLPFRTPSPDLLLVSLVRRPPP
jgi:hypothetical protein